MNFIQKIFSFRSPGPSPDKKMRDDVLKHWQTSSPHAQKVALNVLNTFLYVMDKSAKTSPTLPHVRVVMEENENPALMKAVAKLPSVSRFMKDNGVSLTAKGNSYSIVGAPDAPAGTLGATLNALSAEQNAEHRATREMKENLLIP